jgi:membrane fusion protein (multidrug efflux system)
MKTKVALALLVVALLAGGLAAVWVFQLKKMIAAHQAMTPPPEAVSSYTVREEQWQDGLTAIGSVVAVQGVTLTPDIPGVVREIAFESGARVAAGDLLVRLDTSSEEAQLRAIEAQAELAALNLTRITSLRKDNMIAQTELDAAEANLKGARANADAIRAVIAKKTIRAPFAGELGIRQVNLGEYLDGGKPIVSLQALEPVYVNFSLPQQQLAQLKAGMTVVVTADTLPNDRREGRLTAIDPDLDPVTRSVGVQATFANPDRRLRPGMFVRVEVLLPDKQTVLAIPATALLSAPYGDSVYLIESRPGRDGTPGLVVRQQFVRTSRARGDFLAVESGVKAGERIVSSGVFKLRNNLPVVENNELVPKASEAPTPLDR